MIREWRRWLRRAEALLCTATPGLYKLVVFASIQHVYSVAELGHTATNMSLAQLAGFFTAIGWASLILVRVPMAADRHQAVDAFYRVAWMAAATVILVSCIAVCVSALTPFAIEAGPFIFLLCGWSAYQVARHYFVAQRSYRVAVLFDLILIGGSYAAVYICKAYEVSSSAALALALLATASVMFASIGAPPPSSVGHRFDRKGLQFGMTNFLSGGVNLMFVPISSITCGVAFAGGFSLLSSVTAVAILLPRAISTTQLPQLAKLTASSSPIESPLRSMHKVVSRSNVAVLGINVLLVIAAVRLCERGSVAAYQSSLMASGVLLATQYAVAMGSVVSSSVMMVFERASETATINLKTTILFSISCSLISVLDGHAGFFCVLLGAIAASVVRNRLVEKHAGRVVQSYNNTLQAMR